MLCSLVVPKKISCLSKLKCLRVVPTLCSGLTGEGSLIGVAPASIIGRGIDDNDGSSWCSTWGG